MFGGFRLLSYRSVDVRATSTASVQAQAAGCWLSRFQCSGFAKSELSGEPALKKTMQPVIVSINRDTDGIALLIRPNPMLILERATRAKQDLRRHCTFVA